MLAKQVSAQKRCVHINSTEMPQHQHLSLTVKKLTYFVRFAVINMKQYQLLKEY